MFGADLKAGDSITITHRGRRYEKQVEYTSPFGHECLGDTSKYVYFTDGTNLQPDDGATYTKVTR
jgi:hypothetical protein